MTSPAIRNWQGVQSEVLRRINTRHWKPGDLIPNEADLATEFGCARATVNRALRALADRGLLDRRRRAGTRVAIHPVRKATLNIPILKQEIEQRGQAYDYALISRRLMHPPADIRARLRLTRKIKILHVEALHMADCRPYVFENRWINVEAVPAVAAVDFTVESANKWLVEHAPYTSGDIAFSATMAGDREVELLSCLSGEALFVIERLTFTGAVAITTASLTFAPGYRMHTQI